MKMQTLPIRPLHNKIFFQFEEDVMNNTSGNRTFEEKTDQGIVIRGSTDDAAKQPRWAIVIGIGPEVSEGIKVGNRVAISPLRWTEMFTIDEVDFWQTNCEEILLVQE